MDNFSRQFWKRRIIPGFFAALILLLFYLILQLLGVDIYTPER